MTRKDVESLLFVRGRSGRLSPYLTSMIQDCKDLNINSGLGTIKYNTTIVPNTSKELDYNSIIKSDDILWHIANTHLSGDVKLTNGKKNTILSYVINTRHLMSESISELNHYLKMFEAISRKPITTLKSSFNYLSVLPKKSNKLATLLVQTVNSIDTALIPMMNHIHSNPRTVNTIVLNLRDILVLRETALIILFSLLNNTTIPASIKPKTLPKKSEELNKIKTNTIEYIRSTYYKHKYVQDDDVINSIDWKLEYNKINK